MKKAIETRETNDARRVGMDWRRVGAWGAMIWLAAMGASGQFVAPLYVGNVEPARDPHGRPLTGSNLKTEAAGRCRVEIRQAMGGAILPPATNGEANALNPLLTEDGKSVGGIGQNTAYADSGLFAMVFTLRPEAGTKLFARAFNAPTADGASFYCDSEVAEVTATGTSLVLAFGEAKPLDDGDADGDGLSNSWEREMGTGDRETADYDGDGMSDLAEWRAGTDATDAGSDLSFQLVRREADLPAPADGEEGSVATLLVRWQSVPGKSYQLQHAEALVGGAGFVDVGEVVTAQEGEIEIDVVVELDAADRAGAFRVKLAEEE